MLCTEMKKRVGEAGCWMGWSWVGHVKLDLVVQVEVRSRRLEISVELSERLRSDSLIQQGLLKHQR